MNSLLIPSSHAELDIIARNLSGSGAFGAGSPEQFYAKILFGSLLSLTITESLFGISVENNRVIVDRPVLIERVIGRHDGCETKIIHKTDDLCELNFFFNKKISGQIKLSRAEVEQKVPPITKQELYELALCRGVQLAFPEVFGHKFYLRAELPTSQQEQVKAIVEQSGKKVVTADQLSIPQHPSKRALSPNSQKVLDWQQRYQQLSLENSKEWDAHLAELNGFTFLNDSQKDDLFDELLGHGINYGVEYDGEKRRFYLLQPAI
ncbi:hypothetical protein GO755_26585 [Spirosoma sp. HMF4905]|uniref:Uncharacterized protein n=1 Tax=Spirosoma arboris TaxID=2682092 RepID=A0A7K1SIT1_9BACT|nr:hypothetical protein [Spirosoma arboris]MVM33634.1 hypothetical protein [Spirosoma arboris]